MKSYLDLNEKIISAEKRKALLIYVAIKVNALDCWTYNVANKLIISPIFRYVNELFYLFSYYVIFMSN